MTIRARAPAHVHSMRMPNLWRSQVFKRFFARRRSRRRGVAALAAGALLGGVLTVATAATPAYAAGGGDGRAYVTNFGNGTVSVIDTATQTVVDTIPVGGGPSGIVVNSAGTLAYVANQTSDSVSVIDLSSDTVSATINIAAQIPGFRPNYVALTQSGGTLLVTDLAQTANALVLQISTSTNTLVHLFGTGSNDLAYGIAVNQAAQSIYVPGAVSNNFITSTPGGFTTVGVGKTPIDVALSPDGSTAFVTNNQSASVSVVNTASNTVTATIPTASLPFGIALDPAGAFAYVTTSGGLQVISTATQSVVATVAATVSYFPAVDPAGGFVYAPSGNNVDVVSTSSNTVAKTITGFSDVRDIAFGPAAQADIAAGVSGQFLDLLSALQFTVTADNLGPDPVTSATITTSIPPQVMATNLPSGCSQSGASIICTFGSIADGTTAQASFSLPLSVLLIGTVSVTSTRTASAPTDPNPANDTASASCTVVSVILATC